MPTAEPAHQGLAKGFTIGIRFHSALVVRLADAKPVQLGHAARADGGWRLYAFADASGKQLRELAAFLAESPNSPIRRFTPKGADIDSVIDFWRSSSPTVTSRSRNCRPCCCRARGTSNSSTTKRRTRPTSQGNVALPLSLIPAGDGRLRPALGRS